MLVSFLIVTCRRHKEIIEALDSIRRVIAKNLIKECSFEVIVLINGEDIQIFNDVKNHLSSFQESASLSTECYISESNVGVSEGRNYLFRKSTGDVLVFIDDDAEIVNEDNFISLIFEEKKKYINLGIIAFRSVNRDYTPRYSEIPVKKKLADKKVKAAKFIGVGHILFKEAVEREDFLYPSNLFYGMEEYYLSMKIINKNFCILYHPGFIVMHKKVNFGRLTAEEPYIYMAANKLYIYKLASLRMLYYCNYMLWSCWIIYKTRKISALEKMVTRLRRLMKNTEPRYYFIMSKNALRYIRKYGVYWYFK